jgi:non-heme chloroperoxidase
MKFRFIAVAVAATMVSFVVPGIATAEKNGDDRDRDRPHPRSLKLQNEFDHIGAEVHSLNVDGRTSYYIDEGSPGQRPVVFIGGQGTSLEAFQLTEFARTTRQELGLRVISVERNGFGESPLDLSLGYDDYVKEVLAVLEHLNVNRFVVMAISGGGAYAAHLAAAEPDRVISLHAAAASSSTLPTRSERDCSATLEELNERNVRWTHNPQDWWGVAPGSPVLVVPGWQTRAYADATRSFYVNGQLGDPSALSHEGMLPCLPGAVVDAERITAPTFLYWGGADDVVPVSVMEQWEQALPNVVRAKVYPGEGHTVQYRHWDQILVDMAGYRRYTVVCRNNQTQLIPNRWAHKLVKRGATLGLCAWATAELPTPD